MRLRQAKKIVFKRDWSEYKKQTLLRSLKRCVKALWPSYEKVTKESIPFELWPDDEDWEIVNSNIPNLTGRYRSLREYRDELASKQDWAK